MNQLKGIHHVTAITSSAEKNYEFFTYVLGMRLVKKTVNQDDIQTYHLFFADDIGSAGTDMTFFDFPGIPKGVHGTNEIAKTSFRVPSDAALDYWVKRFDRLEVKHTGIEEQFGKKTLSFVDFDDQHYQLISDENNKGVKSGTPWQKGPIPLEYAITGLGPIFVRIAEFDYFKEVMEKVLLFKEIAKEGSFHLFEVGEGGNGAQVIVEHNVILPRGQQGYGTVHHAAFRVEDRSVLDEWIKRMESFRFPISGYVNRHFFESLYANVAPQILFEFATDGPGFMGDEPYETLGEKLSLPPFLEPKREEIEKLVRPIDTVRSTKEFKKE
ncbi:ring-cleaving dioxygenase [Heyndrickxia sporothermodurans]|uniref:Ring-cleaving dioxygenase n=2 Tax=Heyndrickxia sporothermodurans TaxID=46224 RepID=A0AB37HLP2_9BACI|nr:ring-cleaving dioxygenase [Heyndrickxia sporothermodurans]MBL5768693.1 ring-cleaving dioxygenase [Heyndrickxia sporothermodurans]MBL5772411.1 ring-cleaving dioxygenase [Heyndrickxia sporothermodurans]MBL5775952.1 ring-cleaving dioxygenase [Heyndrickxia sporothermodurans]MBL5779476.1 ring-cleaving dioxygenase [Heyndrickxia sporothermodurans]MBL5783047.1 ring-cleaving dioxygenase [Heyndrickxia sporothermodurans]